MKHYRYFVIIVGTVIFTACGFDNYDEPQSTLQGRITYEGEALGLRGTGEAIQLQLYQDGYDLRDHITVYVTQDGTFQALLFDGEYKLVTRSQNGPWVNTRDTVVVNLRGSTSVELEVTPYFTISNESFTLSGSIFNADFTVNQIVESAEIEYVSLLISNTAFVDDVSNIARLDFQGEDSGTLSLSMDMSDNNSFASARYLYARVGVRAVGADQAIYSRIVQLKQ